ncbi:MAG: biopolymer transporter ExbD [Calditrichaeota bacterium]|nr:biopolymer transporter ExbD [Calditrichota bacterium]RQW00739.1 MAG: biopolymer transporter ExbD [Calditrichota bacterium]
MAINIEKKSKIKIGIPTASLPDIIFQLLIFFMVSTVLREYQGLKVNLPEASKIEKLPVTKRHVTTIWVDQFNNVVIDDVSVKRITDLRSIVYNKLVDDAQLIVSLRVDENADMGIVTDIQQELRKANALRINYSALPT